MTHILIIVGVFICAIKAANNAGETDLANILETIKTQGQTLARKKFPPLSEQHEQQSAAITNANNFAQSVCDGDTADRMTEAQEILDAINALL